MFLGVVASLEDWSPSLDEVSVVLIDNPLTEFVELPESLQSELRYCNIICGVIRGALEMVSSCVCVCVCIALDRTHDPSLTSVSLVGANACVM